MRGKCFAQVLGVVVTFVFGSVYSPLHGQRFFSAQTNEVGLQIAISGNGAAVCDYDNDGDLDLYFVSRSPNHPSSYSGPNRLFRNQGDGTFIDVAAEAGLQGIYTDSVYMNLGAAWGDFDNDGDADLYVTNKGPNRLYENLGNGLFRDITAQAGVSGGVRESTSAAWFDYDLDGDLDLYVSNFGSTNGLLDGRNLLFRNDGAGLFTDVTEEAGVSDYGWTWSVMPFDANGDWYPDLYVVNDYGANRFYENLGDGSFREATFAYGLADSGHSMGVTIGDYNNDRRFDLYITNIADGGFEETNPLFHNLGSGRFENRAGLAGVEMAGWGWGVEFFDYDLDGDQDIYVVNGFTGSQNHNYFYENNGQGVFTERSEAVGVGNRAEARGLVVFDADGDGRLDLFVSHWREGAAFYRNMSVGNHYLMVELEGSVSNRDGRGAVVTLRANGLSLVRYNDGIDFLGQSKKPLHFGLGERPVVHELTVAWPSGIVQTFTDLPADQTVRIHESEGLITSVEEKGGVADGTPATFALQPNYPNPFNGGTEIRFALPQGSEVDLSIYNIRGERIRQLVRGRLPAGEHGVTWNGLDERAQPAPSGIYLYRLRAQEHVLTRRMALVR